MLAFIREYSQIDIISFCIELAYERRGRILDVNKLRHAIAVARAGSFCAAAERIAISQPTLTRSVRMLEESYSIRLFERGRSGAKLTPEGVQFMAVAEDLIWRIESAHDQFERHECADQPVISFGMGPVSGAALLPLLMPKLSEDLRYRIVVHPNRTLEHMLRKREIDFLIAGIQAQEDYHSRSNEFCFQRLGSSSIDCIVRKDHPILLEPITPAALSRYPTAAGSFVKERFAPAEMERMGLRQPSIELDEYSLLVPFIRQSDYILVMSSIVMLGWRDAGLTVLPIPMSRGMLSELVLVWCRGTELSVEARRAADMITNLLRDALEHAH